MFYFNTVNAVKENKGTLPLSIAKEALRATPGTKTTDGSELPRTVTARMLRQTIFELSGVNGDVVIESNTSLPIALAYLERLGWEINTTNDAVRFRINGQGELVRYVRVDAVNPNGPGAIVLFAPALGQHVEPDMELYIPDTICLANTALTVPTGLGSVTNVVLMEKAAMLVYKILLNRWLGGILNGAGELKVTDFSPEKALKEYQMLKLIAEAGIPTPRVLSYKQGEACIVLELETGPPLSEVVMGGGITESTMVSFAIFLAGVHKRLALYTEDISRFPIPKDHTANTVVNFCMGARELENNPHDWLRNIGDPLRNPYTLLVEGGKSLLHQFETYACYPHPIYGDAKDENVLTRGPESFALIDPVLCMGRRSMDIAKFLRSILIKDFSAFSNFRSSFMDAYNRQTDEPVDPREVAHMLALDMLNIFRSYLSLPEERVGLFPQFVRDFRAHAQTYLDEIIPKLLNGNLYF